MAPFWMKLNKHRSDSQENCSFQYKRFLAVAPRGACIINIMILSREHTTLLLSGLNKSYIKWLTWTGFYLAYMKSKVLLFLQSITQWVYRCKYKRLSRQICQLWFFLDFPGCLRRKKKNKPIGPLKQLKSLVYLNKTPHLNPKTFAQAHFRIFK